MQIISKTQLIENYKQCEFSVNLILITFVVITFNLHSVFGLDMLWQDDNSRYYTFANNLDAYKLPQFLGFGYALKWFFVEIFGNYSIQAARLILLIALMIPLSWLLYIFNRKVLKLSNWVSLLTAILINTIPNQYQIPAFLDGSYTVSAMLVFIITLISVSLYLQDTKFKLILLTAASISWLLVCDLGAEMGIFLFLPLLYFIYSSESYRKKKLYLYATITVITAFRIALYIQVTGYLQNRKPVNLTIQEITSRIVKSIDWWLPFNFTKTMIIIIGGIVVILLIYAFIKSLKSSEKDFHIPRAYIFYSIWYISCSLPFWFITPYTTARHFYISYIALTALTLMAIYQLFIALRRHKQLIATLSLIMILSLYGIQRYLLNVDNFNLWNERNSAIHSLLLKESISSDTQIALVGIIDLTGGYYLWSSGYLEYLLKEPGLRGIMGREINFYDPFNLKQCAYSQIMSCLDTNKKLIAFKKGSNQQHIRMNYFLQWLEIGKRDSEWVIYSTNSENNLSIYAKGIGFEDYTQTLIRQNLSPGQILWGNYKDKDSIKLF